MARKRSRWLDVCVYGVARLAFAIVNALPERPAYAVVGGVGRLFYRCSRRRQQLALRFLRRAFPDRGEAELLRLGRVATGNVFKVVLDAVRIERWVRAGRLAERFDLQELRDWPLPPPFLAISPHLGSWEVAGMAVAAVWGESHVLAHVFRNPLLQSFIVRTRERLGMVLHPRRGGIRALTRAMENGHIGMQLPDQHQRLRGVWVPFFGHLASTERSAAVLALRRGYPILVGAAIRTGPGLRFAMRVQEPLLAEPTGDHEADLRRVAAAMNRRMERLILEYPEQYLWIHNRYRKPPSDVANDHPA